MPEDVTDYRSQFEGILSHDLRAPLATISMAADLLVHEGNLDGVQVKLLRSITRGTERMTGMLGQLLDFTQSRLGGLPLEPGPCDLGEISGAVLQQRAPSGAAKVRYEVQGDVRGHWDSELLMRAVASLIDNAIEHAAPGTAPEISVSATNSEVVLSVSNVAEDSVEASSVRAFRDPLCERVFREPLGERILREPLGERICNALERPRVRHRSGHLGLGLYLARQIALAHNGNLSAHCIGNLATLILRLPRTERGPLA